MSTIVFQVNLEAPLRNESAPVSSTRSEGDNLKNTRSTWLPCHLHENRVLDHGDTFTVSGAEAKYLKDNYTSGDYAVLTIVSESIEFTERGEVV